MVAPGHSTPFQAVSWCSRYSPRRGLDPASLTPCSWISSSPLETWMATVSTTFFGRVAAQLDGLTSAPSMDRFGSHAGPMRNREMRSSPSLMKPSHTLILTGTELPTFSSESTVSVPVLSAPGSSFPVPMAPRFGERLLPAWEESPWSGRISIQMGQWMGQWMGCCGNPQESGQSHCSTAVRFGPPPGRSWIRPCRQAGLTSSISVSEPFHPGFLEDLRTLSSSPCSCWKAVARISRSPLPLSPFRTAIYSKSWSFLRTSLHGIPELR